MHVEKKRTIEVISALSKLDDTIQTTVRHHEQRADHFLHKKVSNEPTCFNREDKSVVNQINLSLQSISAINKKEFLYTSDETQNSDIGKYKTSISESNTIRQLEYSSCKYKNPYSIFISNRVCCEKSSHATENVLKDDEPQEGRTERSILSNCREYLANYQESCGTPRTEYSFAALIIVMAQATAQSLWALIYVIVNVASVIQMFSFILRFVLDKLINIRRTKNFQQVMVKFAILAVQLLSVYVCLVFIFDFIVSPIVRMAVGIATKLVMRD